VPVVIIHWTGDNVYLV